MSPADFEILVAGVSCKGIGTPTTCIAIRQIDCVSVLVAIGGEKADFSTFQVDFVSECQVGFEICAKGLQLFLRNKAREINVGNIVCTDALGIASVYFSSHVDLLSKFMTNFGEYPTETAEYYYHLATSEGSAATLEMLDVDCQPSKWVSSFHYVFSKEHPTKKMRERSARDDVQPKDGRLKD
jgi:hypothetical protein